MKIGFRQKAARGKEVIEQRSYVFRAAFQYPERSEQLLLMLVMVWQKRNRSSHVVS